MVLDNKSIARKAASIWVSKDLALLNEVYDENCIHHQQSEHHDLKIVGLEEWRKCMEEFLHKYPDYKETIIHQIAENDFVVSTLDCSVSSITWSGVTIDRIKNGKIAETWVWFKRIPKTT
ncbi:MAG: ester cyclase [Parachlamydiaceae bacterium]